MPKDATIVQAEIKALGEFYSFGTKKEIKFLPETLRENETIQALTSGMMDGTTWLLCVTDQRLIFLDKGMIMGLKQTEIPLSVITSVNHKVGILLAEITITAAGKDKKIDNIQKSDAPHVASVISDLLVKQMNPGTQSIPTAAAGPEDLKKWAELRDQNIITNDEFEAKKAQILGL